MKSAAIAALLLVAILAACGGGDEGASEPAQRATDATVESATDAKPADRKIILVAGMGTSSDTVVPTFLSIVADLKELGFTFGGTDPQNDDFVLFSYNPAVFDSDLHPEDASLRYGPEHTYDVYVPSTNFYRILDEFPDSSFDIIGHSLGGVIALHWAANAPDEYLARVHSIVTLDSPVGGTGFIRRWFAFFGVSGVLAQELPADSAAIQAVAGASSRIDVVTLANINDIVVPSDTATLPGTWAVLDKPMAYDAGELPLNSGAFCITAYLAWINDPELSAQATSECRDGVGGTHGLITSNEIALEWIRAAILSDGPRWVARRAAMQAIPPQPTPTPERIGTPTPTATSTVAPSQVTTSSPTPTRAATPVAQASPSPAPTVTPTPVPTDSPTPSARYQLFVQGGPDVSNGGGSYYDLTLFVDASTLARPDHAVVEDGVTVRDGSACARVVSTRVWSYKYGELAGLLMNDMTVYLPAGCPMDPPATLIIEGQPYRACYAVGTVCAQDFDGGATHRKACIASRPAVEERVAAGKRQALSDAILTRVDSGNWDNCDYMVVRDRDYDILYFDWAGSADYFLISILRSPFEEKRQVAEQAFRSLFSGYEDVICQVNVRLGTPFFANPSQAGQNFSLSFCESD